MIVTVSTWELSLPGSRSLKDKRSALRSLKDRLSNRFGVSVLETGLQDVRNRGELSVAFLAPHNAHADAVLEKVDRAVSTARDIIVVRSSVERF